MTPDDGSTKGARTAARVREIAFEALRADGWRATTMRGIADRAGVSPGTIYLSMPSKEHLLLALYDDTVARIEARATEAIGDVRPFADRLGSALEIALDEIAPFHRVATEAIGQAITADSPVSPFGETSRASRERMLGLFAAVVDGSDLIADRQLRQALPELLWGLLMAGMLAWTNDRSREQRRTRALVAQAVPMLDRAIRITAVPLLRSQVRDLLALAVAVRELSDDDA
ncbi:TetR family transcriptional regulator [Agrococcus sp. ARC_14]|uniref:TetR/AcrR family transcriptional regulator n=1 Tax=Agrococcus sp. ARC_14 TaxID=2919927 RepID=UPI001F05F3DF|nr:TetR family transcriptional regulator [Agrococcus sp. ARC_14]MCH1883440.1 TetR family transcriptional regulator [Agrococcus sp. ARC_14]